MAKGKNKKKDDEFYQILLLGMGGVGKSSIVLQLVFNEFKEEYDPTRVESYSTKLNVDGTSVNLNIMDTSGQEDLATVRDNYIRASSGFLVLFSIVERDSFSTVDDFIESVHRVKETDLTPIIIVGNKKDLEERRTVWSETAEAFAAERHLAYKETSAKTAENIKDVFAELVRQMRQAKWASENEASAKKKSKKKKQMCTIL